MSEENNSARLTALELKLYAIEQSNLTVETPNQSRDIVKLAIDLTKANGEIATLTCDKQNPYYKSNYATLSVILGLVRPTLSKYGISFYQYTKLKGDETILHSRLLHVSGQWIESHAKITPDKKDAQSWGKEMTYKRRYSAMAILGIAPANDPTDDDGNAAVEDPRKKNKPDTIEVKAEYGPERVNAEQLKRLKELLSNFSDRDMEKKILKAFKIKSLSDMNSKDAIDYINKLR